VKTLIIKPFDNQIVSLPCVESRSAHDQNTSWVIVGYPRWKNLFNKEFSQLVRELSPLSPSRSSLHAQVAAAHAVWLKSQLLMSFGLLK
jgi:hypothetical protein